MSSMSSVGHIIYPMEELKRYIFFHVFSCLIIRSYRGGTAFGAL